MVLFHSPHFRGQLTSFEVVRDRSLDHRLGMTQLKAGAPFLVFFGEKWGLDCHERTMSRDRFPAQRCLAYWLFARASSNSSPFCHPTSLGRLAASHPSANPNRAIAESPTKSISGWYSSLGW